MNRKLFFTLALAGAFIAAQPSFSATEVFTNATGATGAAYNSITGGNIVSDGTTCTVNVNPGVAGATANWQTLNVPQANTLNFFFPQGGQYALNKVSSGVSNIAGHMGYATGSQAGTVIISNPNGVLCSGSSVINMAGSLLLTTHNINAIDDVNKIMTLSSTPDALGLYHGVTVMPGAQMTLGGNLTIASLGIDVNGANITSKDAILVTSDGLNYVLAEKPTAQKFTNVTSADTQPGAVYYNTEEDIPRVHIQDVAKTKVANTAIKTTDGKIVIKSNAGNVDVESTKFDGATDLIAKNDVNVKASATLENGAVVDQSKGAFLEDVNITAGKDVTISSTSQDTTVPVYKNITVNADGKITMKNVRMMNPASKTATLNAGDALNITNYDTTSPDWSKTIMGNVVANAKDVTITQTQVQGNSDITATNSINSYGSLLGTAGKTTKLNAKNIIVDEGPMTASSGYIARTRGTLEATATESIKLANNYLIPSESADLILDAPSITFDNFSAKSAIFKNVKDLDIAGSEIFGDLGITGLKDNAGNLLTNVSIDDLEVGGDFTTTDLNKFELTNSTVNGDYTASNINDLKLDNDTFNGNVNIDPAKKAVVDNSTIAGNFTGKNIEDLSMDNDTIGGNVVLDTIDKTVVKNSTVNGDLTATKTDDITLTNDIIKGNVTIDPAVKATVNDSTINGDFTAKNITDTLSMDNDTIGGNVILDTIATTVITDSEVGGDLTATKTDDITLDNDVIHGKVAIGPAVDVTINKLTTDDGDPSTNNSSVTTNGVTGTVTVTNSNIDGDYNASDVNELVMDNDNINGNVNIDPANKATVDNSNIAGDFTAKNISDTLSMNNDTIGGNVILDEIDTAVVKDSTVNGDLTASNIDDLTLDNDIIHGSVTVNPADTVVIKDTTIDNDLTAKNIDDLTLTDDTVGGNIYLDDINKIVMDGVKAGGDIITNQIANFTTNNNDNTYQNGKPYTYNPNAGFGSQSTNGRSLQESDNVLSAYVDSLDIGDAPNFNAGSGEFSARAFAAGDDDDEDYKEEFLRKSVKEDKDGNLYTIDTFKGE